MTPSDDHGGSNTLVAHLEALRHALIMCLAATALLYPPGYWLSPYVIGGLVKWSVPPEMGELHYFSPMEVFWVRLKLALVLALAGAYPWNAWQLWKFLLPALYEGERRKLGWWMLVASILFFAGVGFCVGCILPMVMRFAGGFATAEIQPMLGLAKFIELAGWLALAFGVMFQAPLVVLLAVRFGLMEVETLRRKRPYVIVAILVIAALLTPPDVVSQLALALPTWLLFEMGLWMAAKTEKESK